MRRQAEALSAYRAARDELVARIGVEPGPELRRLHEAILRQDPALAPTAPAMCPFKGLAFFDVDDRRFFGGRRHLVAELVGRLPDAPMLTIVGGSGSGKSSILRAGLLAELAHGVLPGSERWEQTLVRPGDHPRLEETTARVIAIDQFEELFTASGEEERAAFVDALVARTQAAALVIVAIRSDYYGHCAAYPELARMVAANQVLLSPMRRHELRDAIEAPAARAGVFIEPELVDVLVADVEGQPGALPLLSTTLLELWRRGGGRSLRLADYDHAGGVDGAVARLAERATSVSPASSAGSRGACCCASPARAKATPSCVGGSRSQTSAPTPAR